MKPSSVIKHELEISLQILEGKIGKDINWTTELIVLQIPVRRYKEVSSKELQWSKLKRNCFLQFFEAWERFETLRQIAWQWVVGKVPVRQFMIVNN
jgi:hypothetical protein